MLHFSMSNGHYLNQFLAESWYHEHAGYHGLDTNIQFSETAVDR